MTLRVTERVRSEPAPMSNPDERGLNLTEGLGNDPFSSTLSIISLVSLVEVQP